MALMISDACISCGSCEPECPNQAISQGADRYVIDPNRCTECVGFYDSPQCQAVCPVDAPVPDPNHQESKEQLMEKFKKLHPDKA
ncbi:MAG: YfhL family 4Fe-4S dicluster ferredoxin [Acidobacteria bacterium]|nr:YfhL family 4Fe-4S dicluster ferredoxin [Acidobacteriota bacterium]